MQVTNNTCVTVPDPGIPELLRELQQKGIALAVASNKYQEGTEKLVHYYFEYNVLKRNLSSFQMCIRDRLRCLKGYN